MKAKADCDISKLKEKLLVATEALGERSVDGSVTSGYGTQIAFLSWKGIKRSIERHHGRLVANLCPSSQLEELCSA